MMNNRSGFYLAKLCVLSCFTALLANCSDSEDGSGDAAALEKAQQEKTISEIQSNQWCVEQKDSNNEERVLRLTFDKNSAEKGKIQFDILVFHRSGRVDVPSKWVSYKLNNRKYDWNLPSEEIKDSFSRKYQPKIALISTGETTGSEKYLEVVSGENIYEPRDVEDKMVFALCDSETKEAKPESAIDFGIYNSYNRSRRDLFSQSGYLPAMRFPTTEVTSENLKDTLWCRSEGNPGLSPSNMFRVLRFLENGHIVFGSYRLQGTPGEKTRVRYGRTGYTRQSYSINKSGKVTIREPEAWVKEQTEKNKDKYPSLVPEGKSIAFDVEFRLGIDGKDEIGLMVFRNKNNSFADTDVESINSDHMRSGSLYFSCDSLGHEWTANGYGLHEVMKVEEEFKAVSEKSYDDYEEWELRDINSLY